MGGERIFCLSPMDMWFEFKKTITILWLNFKVFLMYVVESLHSTILIMCILEFLVVVKKERNVTYAHTRCHTNKNDFIKCLLHCNN